MRWFEFDWKEGRNVLLPNMFAEESSSMALSLPVKFEVGEAMKSESAFESPNARQKSTIFS